MFGRLINNVILTLVLFGSGSAVAQAAAEVELSLAWDASIKRVTVLAYPNFAANKAVISTATITIMVPEGTEISPTVPVMPDTGRFVEHIGIWEIQRLTPSMYAGLGLDPADLEGKELYLATLAPATASWAAQNNVAVKLFSFDLPNSCQGNVEVMENDSAIQQALMSNLSLNYNNQVSVAMDGGLTSDRYSGNDFRSVLNCNRAK